MAKRTALYDVHAAAGATFTEFAGYDMPVHYGSIQDEHAAVRETAGLFDVSHMSNVWVTGRDAGEVLGRFMPFDAAALSIGRGKYSVALADDGSIIDDLFVFHCEDERYLVVPNAGRSQAFVDRAAWFTTADTAVDDDSAEWSIFALQGPGAADVLAAASDDPPPKFHRMVTMHVGGKWCLVSGTGYTGEKGVELYVPNGDAAAVWDALRQDGVRPIGLGARDTLRLEKGYCLAGNEFAGGRTPLEAGLGWLIDWQHEFAGKDALLAQKDGGHDRLVGLTMERGIPRAGYDLRADGKSVGVVTSGTRSPTLRKGIALGYVDPAFDGEGVDVDVRGRPMPATIAKPPFV